LLFCNISSAQIFEEVTGVEITGAYKGSVAWGDYNNDGLMDFMITGHYYENTIHYYYSAIYNNRGNNNFNEIPDVFERVNESSLEWGDYNNDNYIDILLSGFRSESKLNAYSEIYKNNADKTFTLQDNISFVKTGTGEMKFGDFNRDGVNDVLQCGLTKYGQVIANVYENRGNNYFDIFLMMQKGYEGCLDWGDYNNDGYMDFIIAGLISTQRETKIFKNQGDTIFVEQTYNLISNIAQGSVQWGDYDNNGFLDIIISGNDSVGNCVTDVYKNFNGNLFTKLDTENIPKVCLGSVIWGDYNNDGMLDIYVTGWASENNIGIEISKLYKNNGNDTFSEQENEDFIPVGYSSIAFCDYDNDFDLDILLNGNTSEGNITKIYKNNTPTPNIRPNVITNLQAEIVGEDVILSWDEGTDDNQPSAGLNYNIYVYDSDNREHIISGDTVYENMYIASPQAFPYHHPLNGKRLFPKRGQIQGVRENGRVSYMLKGFVEDCKGYYWSVQAIDASFEGGPFAEEAIFSLDSMPPEISCVDDFSISLEEGQTVYTVTGTEFDPVMFYDNCPNAKIVNNYNNSETLQGEEIPAGNYTITWTVTDIAGNQSQCNFYLEIKEFVDIIDISEGNITVFPNPTTGNITIYSPLTKGDGGINLDIYDLTGRIVYSTNYTANQLANYQIIELSNFSSGIYFMQFIFYKNGTLSEVEGQTTKLIIQ